MLPPLFTAPANKKDVNRDYKLCYSSVRDGFDTKAFHKNCDGLHDFFVVHQRSDNKRVFGGYYGGKSWSIAAYKNPSYTRSNHRGAAWSVRENIHAADHISGPIARACSHVRPHPRQGVYRMHTCSEAQNYVIRHPPCTTLTCTTLHRHLRA